MEMEKWHREMEDKIESIDKKVDRLIDALIGSPYLKGHGIIDRMNEKMNSLENKIIEIDGNMTSFEKKIMNKMDNFERVNNIKHQSHYDFKKKIIIAISTLVGLALIIEFLINIYSNLKK